MNADRYLRAHCGPLAVAIWRLTGFELVELLEPFHVLVRLPDGFLLDASGPHDPEVLDRYRHRRVTGEELAARGFGHLAAAPDVVSDARALLAACGLAEPAEEVKRPGLPWVHPAGRRVSAVTEPGSCGLAPA